LAASGRDIARFPAFAAVATRRSRAAIFANAFGDVADAATSHAAAIDVELATAARCHALANARRASGFCAQLRCIIDFAVAVIVNAIAELVTPGRGSLRARDGVTRPRALRQSLGAAGARSHPAGEPQVIGHAVAVLVRTIANLGDRGANELAGVVAVARVGSEAGRRFAGSDDDLSLTAVTVAILVAAILGQEVVDVLDHESNGALCRRS
jgi:hypothetical protein